MFRNRIIWGVIAVIFCMTGMFMYASMADVPMDTQTDMLLKALGYDRATLSKDGDIVRIGIVYNENNAESASAFEKAGDCLFDQISAGRRVGNKKLTFSGLGFTGEDNLKSMATSLGVSVLYVTPGNETNLASISNVAKSESILTFGSKGEYVSHGLATGVEMDAGKARMVINLANAKAQGANFKAEFLKIARLVQ